MAFFTTQLHVSPSINLAILNQADWSLPNRQFRVPYGTPYSVPGLVVLPATLDFDKQLTAALKGGLPAAQLRAAEAVGRPIEQQIQDFFEDIAYHELGHLYEFAYGVQAPNHWVNELLASYLMFAYLEKQQPERAKNMLAVGALLGQATQPAHTSLADFEHLYLNLDPLNYGWYQWQFMQQASAVNNAEKFNFIDKMKTAFPAGPSLRLTPAEVLARVDQISPGFAAWERQLPPPATATK